MKVLSLFDGIGGGRQALKELNIDCEYFAIEIDSFASHVAESNHSDIFHLGYCMDVKLFLCKEWDSVDDDLQEAIGHKRYKKWFIEESLDLLIGGSPCQDLSIAKKDRKGLKGDRSSLFYEYLRILNETKPKYFILENVASMGKESQEIITKELFNIEPVMINSALLTAQNRKRLYWVGELIDGEYKQIKIDQPKDKEIYLKDVIESDYNNDLTFAHVNNSRIVKKDDKARTLTATYYKGVRGAGRPMVAKKDIIGEHLDNVKKPIRIGHFNSGGQGDRVYSINGKSVCLSANGGGRGAKTGLYKIGDIARMLTPNECCRLQGFPDSYVSMVSNTQGYKGLGNSFTVPVIKHILQKILKS